MCTGEQGHREGGAGGYNDPGAHGLWGAHEAAHGLQPISGRVDRASATEAVDSGSIPGRVKPKTIKIGIHSFPA